MHRVEAEYRALDRTLRGQSRHGLDRPVPACGKRAQASRERWTYYKDAPAHILFWKQYQLETIAGRPDQVKPARTLRSFLDRRLEETTVKIKRLDNDYFDEV